MKKTIIGVVATIMFVACVAFLAQRASGHCDTLAGPVVTDAKAALDKGSVTPVLKWVRKADEGGITALFDKTVEARKKCPEAKDLLDMYFFETLVRIHRAGEGVAYTGLKAEAEIEPGIAEADEAIETGSAEKLAKALSAKVAEGITERFAKVVETKKHAEESVDAGREYVEAYVTFIHYVEKLEKDAEGLSGHAAGAAESAAQAHSHSEKNEAVEAH